MDTAPPQDARPAPIRIAACGTTGETKRVPDTFRKRMGASRPPWYNKTDWIKDFVDFANPSESDKAAANHAVGFTPPIYNVRLLKRKSQ